eukprot:TRINITY_DN11341_c0_g1_i2.p1 TRINITY_DN11341_c0_g1~~TRINITY_DN11341_c0_g1_i2.p1  ORF type:complete len:1226 (+),score=295.66 TRINITY_DN11341_c0_g1_i2:167-3844(+)
MAYSAPAKIGLLLAATAMLFLSVQLYLTREHSQHTNADDNAAHPHSHVRVERSDHSQDINIPPQAPTVKLAVPAAAVAVGGYGNVDSVPDSGVDADFHIPPLPTKAKKNNKHLQQPAHGDGHVHPPHNEAHGNEMMDALHDKFRHGAQAIYPDDGDSQSPGAKVVDSHAVGNKANVKAEQFKAVPMRDSSPSKTSLSWNADPNNVAFATDASDIAVRNKAVDATLTGSSEAATDLKVKEIHDGIDFKDMSRGWHPKHVKYDRQSWKKRKLQVVLMPHTHVDPGWIKTLEQYFHDQTQHILNVVVDYLDKASYRKFIWAEISFLSMWWDRASSQHREALKRVVKSGQFEIVTGGWVMTDEASSHVYAMVDQLIEGQRWVNRTFGVIPRTGWSIDPFGQSSTMAMINNRAGVKSMIIDRIHWRLKQFMQRNKQLVFRWRQHWDKTGITDMLTHVLPFYLYDVHYTCGPDYATCCKLDFGMRYFLKTSSQCSEFGKSQTVNPVNADTVHALSQDLLHEYRKMSQLFKHDVILHPIGGDFRYVNSEEIHAMLDSYAKMMEHLNNDPDADVEVRFGTLRDYFELLEQRAPGSTFSTLSGDFMPYNDRKDHYWSGYFTTRPMYKRMSRVLETELRAADIFNSLAMTETTYKDSFLSDKLSKLSNARRQLGLFQHHDAITGTCKKHVSEDYGKRMMRGYKDATVVHTDAISTLLALTNPSVKIAATILVNMDRHNRLPQPVPLSLQDPTTVAISNSLARRLQAPIRLRIKISNAVVKEHETGTQVTCQVTPVFKLDGSPTNEYDLWFEAELDALAIALYDVSASDADNPVSVASELAPKLDKFTSIKRQAGDDIALSNEHLALTFDANAGTLTSIKLRGSTTEWALSLDFATYSSKGGSDQHSGAYLFIPAAKASSYTSPTTPIVTVVKGDYVQEVHVFLAHIHHTIRLFTTSADYGKAPFMDNIVHINNDKDGARPLGDGDFIIRVKSAVDTGKDFFSDANGYQTMRRRRRLDMGIGGNYMPLSSHVFVQSQAARLTWLTDTPLGASSLETGSMEMMLDRSHSRDDNLGMGEGITDSIRYRQQSVLLLEPITHQDTGTTIVELTRTAHSLFDVLQGPTAAFKLSTPLSSTLKPFRIPQLNLPVTQHMLTLRTDKVMDATQLQTQLLLFKRGLDCQAQDCQSEANADLRGLMQHFKSTQLEETALSGTVSVNRKSDGLLASVGSYDLRAYLL